MEIYKVALQGCGFVNWLKFDQPMTFNEDLVLTQVYETLFNKNEFGNIKLGLAQNYSLKDQLLIINLKARNFHDGSQLCAQDVLCSLKQAFESPYKHNNNGWTGDHLKFKSQDLKLINDYSFSLNLHKYTLEDVLEELCKVKYSIKKGPIGTGPYAVKLEHSTDQKLILKKNINHPKHIHCVDELHLIGFKNNFETLKAFLNNEVDQIRIWGLKSPFEYNENVLCVPSKTFYASYFQFNCKKSKFSTQKSRKHFRNVFLRNIMLHKTYPWTPFTGVIPQDDCKAPIKPLPRITTQTVVLGVAHKRQKKEVERLVNKNLFQSFGYKLKIVNYNGYEKLYNSKADLIYTAFSYEQFQKTKLPQVFHSQHKKNKTGYINHKLDQLIETDIKAAEQFILNQSLMIPLGWFQCHILTHKTSRLFCGIKNNRSTPVLYKSQLEDFIKLYSHSQAQVFKLREKSWSNFSKKAKLEEVLLQFQHDLKSPLSVLRLLSQQIDSSEDIYQRVLQRIEEFNKNIKNEIDTTLEKDTKNSKNFSDINKILSELIEEKLIEIKNLPNLKIEFQASKEVQYIQSCPHQLKRVLSNLINNAIESRDKWNHKITIKADRLEDFAVITIKDNGMGFTQQQLKSALSQPKISNKKYGQGLGLYTAKQFFEEKLTADFLVTSREHQFTEIKIQVKQSKHFKVAAE